MPTKCEILTEVHYMERVHPRNCRKDRVRENIFLANAVFEAFTEDEAPVALIVKYYDLHRPVDPENIAYECNEMPCRLANGKLYTLYSAIGDDDRLSIGAVRGDYDLKIASQDDKLFVPVDIGKELSCFDDRYAWYTANSEERMAERFHDAQRKYIMIGNELWHESTEPAYELISTYYGTSTRIVFPSNETEYRYNASEWGNVVEKIKEDSFNQDKIDFANEDKIEVLIPEAVALPASWEKSDLQRGARAVNHLVKAMDELKSFNKAEWLNASLCANETEGFLRKYLCGIVYRRQRGTDMLTEEQLNAATEQAYNDLLNRTRIDRY